jgi:hypothetical protein
VRPASEPCPPEATAAAEELGHFDGAHICLDQTQPCEDKHKPWLKEGPVTGRMFEDSHTRGGKTVPEGSLLFGEVRITDAAKGEATVRYTLLQLPNGNKYPVCLETAVGNGVPAKEGTVQAMSDIQAPFNVAVRTVPLRAWDEPW